MFTSDLPLNILPRFAKVTWYYLLGKKNKLKSLKVAKLKDDDEGCCEGGDESGDECGGDESGDEGGGEGSDEDVMKVVVKAVMKV